MVLIKTFNDPYVNVVEKPRGKKPKNVTHKYGDINDNKAMRLFYKTSKFIKV